MILDASGITYSYGRRPALRGVDLKLFQGELVALIGPNGSGKSTLIRTLLGALRPDEGQILWDNKQIEKWSRRRLARFVAYLAQSPLYEPGQRVIDCLRLGRAAYWGLFGIESPRDVRIVRDVAGQVGLLDLLHRPMDELSGGQRQLVFIARALVQEPRAILLDEPSAFLDLRHQVQLMQLLRRLARQTEVAILMASHDLNLAAGSADQLILLDRGLAIASGPAEQILEPALLERVYGVEMERIDREGRAPLVVPKP
jgi:iron complex transport system ATP-binding protein